MAKLAKTSHRPLKVLEPSTRRMELVSATYLAYDALGLAIHVENGRIGSWHPVSPRRLKDETPGG